MTAKRFELLSKGSATMPRRAISVFICVILLSVVQYVSAASSIEVRGEWIYVDGEPYLIKGVGYSPSRPGEVPWIGRPSIKAMEDDFSKIKAAGFNTIRTWAPLTLEEIALAKKYGLMVIQGIWVDPQGSFGSEAFQDHVLSIVRQEIERIKGNDNVLLVLVGNELSPERTFLAGLSSTESLLKRSYEVAKQADSSRLVSYANWPHLSGLDISFFDSIGFNLYPYEPSNVSYAFGFTSYIGHLRKKIYKRKPLILTEMGLSVSPKPGPRSGYGGNSIAQQAKEVLRMWDSAFQSGTQGACIFEWNDEWWKQADFPGDEKTHEEDDPEEWFGITGFNSANDVKVTPRPLYASLKSYNKAIAISPSEGESYNDKVPVSVYVTDEVSLVRVRLGKDKWKKASPVSRHWWKAQLQIPKKNKKQSLRFVMEAFNKSGKLLSKVERNVLIGSEPLGASLTIETDKQKYEVGSALTPVNYTLKAVRSNKAPIKNQAVFISISEPQVKVDLVQSQNTDDEGTVKGTYLVRDPGFVMIAAAIGGDPLRPDRRVGDEKMIIVEKAAASEAERSLIHQESVWEKPLPEELKNTLRHESPAFELFDPGKETLVDYEKYGVFRNVGTASYNYEINDRQALAEAVGEGIYPNEQALIDDPQYRKALQEGSIEGSMWDFVYHPKPQLGFFKWADLSTPETPGLKQFFVGLILERAGLIESAAKAYYAVLVHFPDTIGWTQFETPWYVGTVAKDRLEALLRLHPELGLRLEGASVTVENGLDNDTGNDVFVVNPGKLVRTSPESVNPATIDLSGLAVKREIGKGRVRLRQFENGHWQLLVEGKPWVIRGISYSVAAVGESHDEGTYKDWMVADRNNNGTLDIMETFIDSNSSNKQDSDEPTSGDPKLLKEMGINTIRLYHHASNKELLRKLYDEYGIMVLMGDLVGMYTVGSGATWEEGTNYLDPVQRKRMTESVRKMVREFKDEPYVLMWVLGNENNYGGVHGNIGGECNAGAYPKEYYSFLNELAQWVHKEDPNHPVAVANGEWVFVDVISRYAPEIDVFGANVYRGSHGFGRNFFGTIAKWMDRPVFISEFGCPAYQENKSREQAEIDQAMYHFGCWIDLEDNMAGRGVGNAIGGIVFEWVDEWWKAGQPPRALPDVHETKANWSGPFPGGKMFEEWLGLCSMGDGSFSPFLRQLRVAYRMYQKLWNQDSSKQ